MDNIIVLLIVLAAATFVARKIFLSVKSARAAKEGCVDCGCSTSNETKSDWSKT